MGCFFDFNGLFCEAGFNQTHKTFYSLFLVRTVCNDADGGSAYHAEGQNAQQALCIDSAILFLNPDGGFELICFLDEKCSRTSVKTYLVLNNNLFNKHNLKLP